MLQKLTLSLLLLCSMAFASEKHFDVESYDKGLKSDNFLHFDMESTKAGFITTEFTGVVKRFTVNYDIKEKHISNATITFHAKDMDTDIDGRNEKMYGLCLEAKKYPVLRVELTDEIETKDGSYEIPAEILVRGKRKKFPIKLTLKELKKGFLVSGKAQLSLSKLEIPDPSIWIASVNDNVVVRFKFRIGS